MRHIFLHASLGQELHSALHLLSFPELDNIDPCLSVLRAHNLQVVRNLVCVSRSGRSQLHFLRINPSVFSPHSFVLHVIARQHGAAAVECPTAASAPAFDGFQSRLVFLASSSQ